MSKKSGIDTEPEGEGYLVPAGSVLSEIKSAVNKKCPIPFLEGILGIYDYTRAVDAAIDCPPMPLFSLLATVGL